MSVSATPPIVRSLLENDLYKFTMWQAMLHGHPDTQAEYAFVCRNTPAYPLAELKSQVEQELDHLCSLRFATHELEYLRGLRFLKQDFVEFLGIFQFQRKFIKVDVAGDQLIIRAQGPQVHVMGFEIYVLYIVNELYFRRFDQAAALNEARLRLESKIEMVQRHVADNNVAYPFEFFDFGLRRRFSGAWQEEMVARLAQALPGQFKATSNVYLAWKHGLVPIGTMAHEYLQTYQALGVRLRDFQRAALEAWVQEYRGDLGIALTDVVGRDAFLRDFDLYFAKLFDGLRHDSGDPFEWGEKALSHYCKLKIDSRTKRLVFSDGLDLDKAFALHRTFGDRVMTGFGIGTFLSNDTGIKPLNIVMKLMKCNGQAVAKLSDTPGKTLCSNETYLAYLRQVFDIAA